VVLGQHAAPEFRPEVAIHPARQRRHDQLPLRCPPALAPVAHRLGPQHRILDQEILVALEPRAKRYRGQQHPLLHRQPRYDLATAAAVARWLRLGRLPHAARLDRWSILQPLEAGNLLALGDNHPLKVRHLAQSALTSAFNSAGDSAPGSAGGTMPKGNQASQAEGSENRDTATSFAPSYPVRP